MNNHTVDFLSFGNLVIRRLAEYVQDSRHGQDKVLLQIPPDVLARDLKLEKWVKNGGIDLKGMDDFLSVYLKNSQHLHHPNYMGHQVTSPHLASSMADLIHGVINNPMAIYEMGPSAAVIEKFLIQWMLQKIGWYSGNLNDFDDDPNQGAGIMTHGGSLANLTALTAARSAADPDAWSTGISKNLVVLAPEEVHYSIARSIAILGLGSNALIPLPVDKHFRIKPHKLKEIYKQITSEGKKIMAVVINACATATGLYDPVEEVALFCNAHDLWLHVDGAHGMSALLSNREKHKLRGIKMANSAIWDAHKMLRTSALAAAVLFRKKEFMENAFQQKGSYLFHDKEGIGFDLMPYTIECTKTALATKLFWVLAAQGEKGLSRYIEDMTDITLKFYHLLKDRIDFECPYKPESNILCFRYLGVPPDNDSQLKLRNKIIQRGKHYITSTEIGGIRYLRTVILNEFSAQTHLEALIKEIIFVAKTLKPLYN